MVRRTSLERAVFEYGQALVLLGMRIILSVSKNRCTHLVGGYGVF
jgi:hypothetical protein